MVVVFGQNGIALDDVVKMLKQPCGGLGRFLLQSPNIIVNIVKAIQTKLPIAEDAVKFLCMYNCEFFKVVKELSNCTKPHELDKEKWKSCAMHQVNEEKWKERIEKLQKARRKSTGAAGKRKRKCKEKASVPSSSVLPPSSSEHSFLKKTKTK